jgi:steroid delta-isomerase-like uncharacterized protein
MSATQVVQRFFTTWNQHDTRGILTTFAENGVYSDPSTPELLTGDTFVQMCNSLFAALPDLSFELVSLLDAGNGTIATQWHMHGTNTGSLYGYPPTGCKVSLAGADFLTIENEKISSCQRYFDQKTFLSQLGLQVVVQPFVSGPLRFGTAVQLQTNNHTRPGAFSITWFDATSEESLQQINEYGWQILRKMAEMPGFIGYTNMNIGKRQYTISAWDDPQKPRLLLKNSHHLKAVQQFYNTDISSAGHTSVWIPHHINPLWVRCTNCGRQVHYEQSGGKCQCNVLLPEPPPYW